ncbi:microsomal signal peptidase [Babesia ovata]|uniref:Signal peptidase complex subunit 1 n=1 Tax=Babesia ovata TaxID=189622 RepID=A0A2H6K9D5_9APIC|nr:microsomal signal peptidase [Babesia ovata]GBE59600.1 microsomal signal peptidase [Babesia ovata]
MGGLKLLVLLFSVLHSCNGERRLLRDPCIGTLQSSARIHAYIGVLRTSSNDSIIRRTLSRVKVTDGDECVNEDVDPNSWTPEESRDEESNVAITHEVTVGDINEVDREIAGSAEPTEYPVFEDESSQDQQTEQIILLPEDRNRYEYIGRLSGADNADQVDHNGAFPSASSKNPNNETKGAVADKLGNANNSYSAAYNWNYAPRQRNKRARNAQNSGEQSRSQYASSVKSVNLDDLVEDAFKDQKMADNFCVLGYTPQHRDEFFVELVRRLAEHKRKTKNAPHVLYVARHSRTIEKLYELCQEENESFGKVNIISDEQISVAPNNLLTVAELTRLSRIYHAINMHNQEQAGELVEYLRNMKLYDKNANSGTSGEETPTDEASVDSSISGEETPTDEASADTPQSAGSTVTELFFKGDPVDDSNQEEFVGVLRSLIDSFFRSHDEVANRNWNERDIFVPQKETLLSIRKLFQNSYHSTTQLADRLQINEPSKRIVVVDGFAPRHMPSERSRGTALFDLLMIAMRNECQMAAISYQLFNPHNLVQWLRRNVGPTDFVVASKFPECRVFKDDWHFDPFENNETPTYGIADVNFLQKVLTENHMCPRTLFHKPNKEATPSNWPLNKQFAVMLKDILKQAMLIKGVDTLHKLKHHSRSTYDYVKQYLPGGREYKPAEKTGKQDEVDNGMTDEVSQTTEQSGDAEPMTIDDFLDQVIDLGRRHRAVKMMQKLDLDSAIKSMSDKAAVSIIDRVIKDGIYPTVIMARPSDVEAYKPVVLEKFEPIPEIESLLEEYVVDMADVEYVKRGVICLGRNFNPLTAEFVKKHLHLFKVVVTYLQMRGARHYVCQYPLDARSAINHTLRYPTSLLNTVLGAERVSFYAMPPSSTLNVLSSFLSSIPIDFRWFKPLEALKHTMAEIPQEVKANSQLASSLEKGTFAKFMTECSDAYLARNGAILHTTTGDSERVDCCTESYYSSDSPSPTNALETVPSHKWEQNTKYYGTTESDESRGDVQKSAVHSERRQYTYDQSYQPAPRAGAQTPLPSYKGDQVVRNGRSQNGPLMRSMLDRQVHLKTLEGRLLQSGVVMRPFYALDQKWKGVAQFRSYLRNHIRGLLLHKSKAFFMLNFATPLHGADVLGMDGKHYTVVWIGIPTKCTVPNHNLSQQVWHSMRKLFAENSHHTYFAVLKAENGGYLCVPSVFIKDICEMPATGKLVGGAIRASKPAAVVLNPKEGVPQDAMVDRLRYLVMTDEKGNEAEMLPSRMEAASFLPNATLELVRIGLEMVERYNAVEKQLTDDAVTKCSKMSWISGIKASLQKCVVDFHGQNLGWHILNVLLAIGTITAVIVGQVKQDFVLTMKIVIGTGVLCAVVCTPAWPMYGRHQIPWKPVKEAKE